MLDEEEGKDRAEQGIVQLHEVTGPKLLRVFAEERAPARPRRRSRPRSSHVLLHGTFADAEAQLEQLTANPLCAPEPVDGSHLANERDCVGWDRGARARARHRFAPPPAPMEFTMPAQ